MGKIASRRPLLLRFNWARAAIAATLGSCLTCVLLLAGAVHALDPNKRLTQYIHTSWRIQDGSVPAGMFSLRKPPTVSSGSYLFPEMSTGLTVFGFFPGACLPGFHQDHS